MSSSESNSAPGSPENKKTSRSRSSSSSSAPSHRLGTPPAIGDQLGQETPRADGSDSERSHASPEQPTRRRLVESSSDDDEQEKPIRKPSHQGDVFGDDLSSDSDNAEGDVRKGHDSDDDINKSIDGSPQSHRDVEEEQDEQKEAPKIITADAAVMKFSVGSELYHVRMPNFLSIEMRPFVADEYEDIYDEHDLQDEEGKKRLKLKVENTLRWRQVGTEEEPKYESNAKMIKWSDGTMSLMVGSEVFECQETSLLAPTHLYQKQSHGLSGKAIFTKRLKFRPSTTESKTHKKVTMNMADRTKKSGQVRLIQEVGENPDEAKKELIRKEEEALRAAYRRERDQSHRRGRDLNRGRLSTGFLEDRGDYSEDESPKRGRPRKEAPLIGASSDESEDDAKKLEKSKKDSSDSDEEFRRTKQEKKKRIVSSDEESD